MGTDQKGSCSGRVKVLALIDKDPVLLEICKKISSRGEASAKEKMKFIEKQMKDLHEQLMRDNEGDWTEIEQQLLKTGVIEKYDREAHHLHFDLEENVLELHGNSDEGEHPLSRILGRLFTT